MSVFYHTAFRRDFEKPLRYLKFCDTTKMNKSTLFLFAFFLPLAARSQCVSPLASGTTAGLHAVFFTQPDRGYVAGEGGTLRRSTDGGATWADQDARTAQTIQGLYFRDDNNGWAVGDRGLIRHTSNAGANWRMQTSPVRSDLYDVAFSSALTGLIAGECGVILRTTDGGATWVLTPSGTSNTLYSIAMEGNLALTCGEGGVALRSTDGGQTWAPLSGPVAGNFRVAALADTRAWMAGDGGAVWQSADNGDNWSAQTAVGGNWNGLAAWSGQKALLAGSGGKVFRTQDGGAVWTDISNPTIPETLYDVSFADSATAYAAGAIGRVLKISFPSVLAGGPALACPGASVSLSASGGGPGAGYSWSGPGGFASSQQNPVAPAQAGVYTVTLTEPGGCTATATVNVTVNALPQPVATANPAELCSGASVSLNASGGITYTWSGPGGFTSSQQNPQRPDATPSMSGIYTVTVTDANGCTATATVNVTVNALPQPVASANPSALCSGASISFNASGGITYTWSGPGAYTSSQQNPQRPDATSAMSGVYTVTVTDANGCSATATAQAEVWAAPVPNPSASPAHCGKSDGKIDLLPTGAAPFRFDWADLPGVQNTEDRITLPAATYTVTITDANNCSAVSTVTVGNLDGPNAAALPQPAACGQPIGMIDLIPAAGAPPLSFLWNTGDTTEDISGLPAGTYTVTITDAGGCTFVQIAQVFGPAPMETQNLLEDCQGADDSYRVTLTLAGGTPPYKELSGLGAIAGSQFTGPVIPSGSVYTYRFSDAEDCPPQVVNGLHDCNCITQAGTMDPAPLIVCGDTPVTALHQQDQFLAPGAILLFVLHQGSGSNLANPIAWNTVPTFAFTGGVVYGNQYYISAIAGTQNGPGSIDLNNACLSVAPGTPVTFVQQVLSAVSAAICIGDAYTLGDTIVQAPGMYTRVLMGNNGCDSTVQLTLSVRIPDVTLGPDANICLGDSLLLIAKKTGCTGCSVQWSVPGDKDTILVKPNTKTIYSVEIQDNIGCRAQDDITINVGMPVSVDLDVVVCDSMPWYVGGKAYTEPGFYEIPLLSAAGCDSTVNLTLEFADPKTYAALDDTLFYPPGLGLSERTFSLVQNDLLPVGGAWLTTLLDAPQAGTAILAPGGTLVYRLTNTAFLGVDSFTYQLCDTFCTGPCDTGRVVLVVQDGLVEAAEEMPNAFSPNDDEFNPTFDPLFYFKDKKFIVPNGRVSMTILNRWGEIVWHADDYPNGGWDGKSGTGKLVPQGTYYYMLRMALGETIILKGAVTVFR